MAIRPDYDIGELTLTSGSSDFTTSGSSLQTAAVQAGDAIIAPSGHVLIIASITGQNSGTLFLPCPTDAAGTGLPLRIRFQPDGSRYQGAVRNLIDLLSSGNIEAFAALVGSAGLVPIFTGVGMMDLADPATFGIQDPNGTLGQLAALTSFPIAGLLNGFIIANDPTTPNSFISISPGIAINDAGTISMSMPSGMRKGLNANWSGGSGVGGLDVGSVAASTWYHVFAIYNPTEKITDVLFSGSISNPQMPSGYSAKRRIGSIRTDASANIVRFLQTGDYFAYNTPINVISGAWDGGTTPKILPLTVPVGIKVEAVIGATYQTSGTAGQFVFVAMVDPDQGGVVTLNNSMLHVPQDAIMTTIFRVYTDVNGRVLRWGNTTAENDVTVSAWVHGYTDRRGK
jgi:hypothetical protein